MRTRSADRPSLGTPVAQRLCHRQRPFTVAPGGCHLGSISPQEQRAQLRCYGHPGGQQHAGSRSGLLDCRPQIAEHISVRAGDGEPLDVNGQPQNVVRASLGGQMGECGTEVVPLAVQAPEPVALATSGQRGRGRLREAQVIVRVQVPDVQDLRVSCAPQQLLRTVLANGFKQPVPDRAVAVIGDYQAFVDQ